MLDEIIYPFLNFNGCTQMAQIVQIKWSQDYFSFITGVSILVRWHFYIETHPREMMLLSWARELTHWGRDKMAAIFETTFLYAFSCMKMNDFQLKFHRSLLLRFQLTIPALVQIMAWRLPGDKPLSEPMMVVLPTQICVTQPQWVNNEECDIVLIDWYLNIS